eukprot:GDKJ01051151.1.p1 GENE.GDKJ01051151.1~~GDKJ01051151.1.p1  ORF type:complete len:477 (-),score=79.25 GDKJ01051151.1:211-1584(-)
MDRLGRCPASLWDGSPWEGGAEEAELKKMTLIIKELKDEVANLKHLSQKMQRSKKDGFEPRTSTGLDILEVRDLIATKTCVIQREEQELQRRCARLVRERRLFGLRLAILQTHGITAWRCGQRFNENRILLLNLVKSGPTDEIWHAMDLENKKMLSLKVAGAELWSRMSSIEREQVVADLNASKPCYKNLMHNRIRTCCRLDMINGRPVLILERTTAEEPKDLEHFLITSGIFSEREVRSVILQIVSALLKFSSVGLKSLSAPSISSVSYLGGEVMVTPPFPRVLSAFEISYSALVGNLKHLPPEVRSQLPQNMNSSKVDAWAVGVLGYRLLFDQLPSNAKAAGRGYWARDDEELSFVPNGERSTKISKNCEAFLRRLLSSESRRPTLQEIANDPYLTMQQRLPTLPTSSSSKLSVNSAGPPAANDTEGQQQGGKPPAKRVRTSLVIPGHQNEIGNS